jgi:hypothetical protein
VDVLQFEVGKILPPAIQQLMQLASNVISATGEVLDEERELGRGRQHRNEGRK